MNLESSPFVIAEISDTSNLVDSNKVFPRIHYGNDKHATDLLNTIMNDPHYRKQPQRELAIFRLVKVQL